MMLSRRAILTALAATLVPHPTLAQSAPLKVVASFSILADLVAQVGGERVAVTSLVGPDGDAHAYEPVPADAARLADARLIVVNGLGFEGWIDRLVRASGTKASVVVASKAVRPLAGSDGHGHDADPHAWQDVANTKLYVAAIRDALVAADPDGAASYATRAASYLAELDRLDADIRALMAALPPAARQIVTTHDAFAYFGRAYGLRFTAPRGVSSASEASARDVGRIIRQIRADKVPAVFLENVTDPRQLERIAAETGARIGGVLLSDALGPPKSPAATYIGMMRANAETLGRALRTPR